MHYTALEAIIPVVVLDKNLKPIPGIRPYASINKCALYTNIDRKIVDKLVRQKHTKPYFCEQFKQDIFILTQTDYEQFKEKGIRPTLGEGQIPGRSSRYKKAG